MFCSFVARGQVEDLSLFPRPGGSLQRLLDHAACQNYFSDMPGSSTATSSESSRDSESPKKRAPSLLDDKMEVDSSPVDSPFVACEHIRTMTGSSKMLGYYEKALAWSGAKYGADHPHSKRRKVGRSLVSCPPYPEPFLKMQAPTCGNCKNSLHRPVMCLECRFIGCWKLGHIQEHLAQSNHVLGN